MSVTVSGGMLHVPEWSVRLDRIAEIQGPIEYAHAGSRVLVAEWGGVCASPKETCATRDEIIAALEAWDSHQRILAVFGPQVKSSDFLCDMKRLMPEEGGERR